MAFPDHKYKHITLTSPEIFILPVVNVERH